MFFTQIAPSEHERESIRNGMILYLAERRKSRGLFDNVGDLDGLFSKEGYRMGNIKQARPGEKSFYEAYQKQKAGELTGSKASIEAAETGASGATTRIIQDTPDKKEFYFKRAKDSDKALTGKHMAAERAAFLLSDLLGLPLVPPTTIVKYNGQTGSAQAAVPASFSQAAQLTKPPAPSNIEAHRELRKPEYQKAAADLELFTYLGAIQDRHVGNIYVDTAHHQIKSIDHESGFHFVLPPPGSSSDRYLFSGGIPRTYTPEAREKIASLTYDALKKQLEKDLTKDQIRAVWLRVQIVRADMITKHGSVRP